MEKFSKTNQRLDGYFEFLITKRLWILLLFAVLLVASAFLTKRLTLRTNLSELLPDKLESVQNAAKAKSRMGGTGLLLIGVQSPSYESNQKFVEAMALKLQPLVGQSLRFFEYRYLDVQDYLQKYALHYLDNAQLTQLNERLSAEIESRKDQAFGSFLGLSDDSPKKSSSLNDQKIDLTFKKFLEYRDAYLSVDNGKVMAMILRPMAAGLSLDQTRKLRDSVRILVNELNPKSYHPQMRVEFSGNVQQTLEEFDTLKEDLFDTALHLTTLIVGTLFLFVWSIPVILALGFVLLISVIYTFGVTQLSIGYLNSQTAFMASIIVGTGINYGVIYLARFQWLKKTLSTKLALCQAIKDTLTATLIGSSSTAVAFLTLLVSDNKGLSQFGIIGCVGVSFCWIVTYTLLPIIVYEYERLGFRMYPWKNPLSLLASRLGTQIGHNIIKHQRLGIALIVVITAISSVGLMDLLKDPMEYNFDNIRTKMVLDQDFIAFRKRSNSVFPTSLNPSVIFAETEDAAREICPTVMTKKKSLSEQEDVIQGCSSLYDLIPKITQLSPERKALIEQSQSLLKNRLLKFHEYGAQLRAIGEKTLLKIPTEAEIPEQVRRRFREMDGREGLFAFVSPLSNRPLNDGRNMLAFTKSLTDLHLPQSGATVSASGESFIFADILKGIQKDALLISALSFISVLVHCIIFAGGWRNGLFLGLVLFICSWWTLGIQGWMNVKFNFFNFIALPLTFGIGIDYPVNILIPMLHDRQQKYSQIFVSSGTAVLLCSLTTFIGYWTLLSAKSQALASFAHIAIIGEFACLIGALFIVPILFPKKP